VWDILTRFEIANTSHNVYPPNQIPGYATDNYMHLLIISEYRVTTSQTEKFPYFALTSPDR